MKSTKRKQTRIILLPILALGAILLLTACEDRLEGCEGQILVENEIPDLTMHVGDEPFRRDLIYKEPVVFRHTAGNLMNITTTSEDGGIIVSANSKLNPETNRVSIVEVVPRQAGQTVVNIIATDDCLDRMVETSFEVTVLDTTQNINKVLSTHL